MNTAGSDDIRLLEDIACVPDWIANDVLSRSTEAMGCILRSMSVYSLGIEDIKRFKSFWGFTGEMIGEIWALRSTGCGDTHAIWFALQRAAQHAATALDSNHGVPFYPDACTLFQNNIDPIQDPRIPDFVTQGLEYIQPLAFLLGDQLTKELHRWSAIAIVRFLQLYHGVDRGIHDVKLDARGLLSSIAACHAADARMLAIITDIGLRVYIRELA